MINYKDFVKKATKFSNVSVNLELSYCFLDENNIDTLESIILDSCFIEQSWISGGFYGNDCYDTLNKTVDSEVEVYIDSDIIGLFNSLNIDLSINDFSEFVQLVIFNEHEDYYGNYYEFSKKYVYLKDLYKLYISKVMECYDNGTE